MRVRVFNTGLHTTRPGVEVELKCVVKGDGSPGSEVYVFLAHRWFGCMLSDKYRNMVE